MNSVMLSALAAGSRFIGRIDGSTAVRVGWLTAKKACCTANRPSSSQTFVDPSAACSQKPSVETISPTVVKVSSLRLSTWSASAPPHSPNTTSGTSPKIPVSPT